MPERTREEQERRRDAVVREMGRLRATDVPEEADERDERDLVDRVAEEQRDPQRAGGDDDES